MQKTPEPGHPELTPVHRGKNQASDEHQGSRVRNIAGCGRAARDQRWRLLEPWERAPRKPPHRRQTSVASPAEAPGQTNRPLSLKNGDVFQLLSGCALRARGGCQDPSPVLPVLWEPGVQDSCPPEPGVQGASPGQRLQRWGQEMYELGHPEDMCRSSLPGDTGTLCAKEESSKMLPSEKRKKKRMVPAGWSSATGGREDGAHQPPVPESSPAGCCPSDHCFKISKWLSFRESLGTFQGTASAEGPGVSGWVKAPALFRVVSHFVPASRGLVGVGHVGLQS